MDPDGVFRGRVLDEGAFQDPAGYEAWFSTPLGAYVDDLERGALAARPRGERAWRGGRCGGRHRSLRRDGGASAPGHRRGAIGGDPRRRPAAHRWLDGAVVFRCRRTPALGIGLGRRCDLHDDPGMGTGPTPMRRRGSPGPSARRLAHHRVPLGVEPVDSPVPASGRRGRRTMAKRPLLHTRRCRDARGCEGRSSRGRGSSGTASLRAVARG